jgi:hypothetical protein
MRISQWKAVWQDLIDGVQGELGIRVPALDKFRARLDEARLSQERKPFDQEIEAFLDSQPFLREAAQRYLSKKASGLLEKASIA